MRHYFDHASAAPLRPEAAGAMTEAIGLHMADPGRVYDEAFVIRQVIEDARTSVSTLVNIRPRQLLFTSSIAESVETAIRTARAARPASVIVASAIERSSVLDAAMRTGDVVLVDVDARGQLTADALAATLGALEPNPAALVCCQVGNHETGAINDVASLLDVAREFDAPTHLDVTTALATEPIDLERWRPTFASLSSELIGGPAGVAGLTVASGTFVTPITVGGDQERGRRAGLENVIGIVGFGAAATVLGADGGTQRDVEASRLRRLGEMLLDGVADIAELSLVSPRDATDRLASVLCFTIASIEAEAVVMGLNRQGFAVHSGSACSSEELRPSPVLAAMGLEAARSLRISFGWSTTEPEVLELASELHDVTSDLVRLSR